MTNKLKPKRPTKKPITAVMLEYIGESENWEWYDIMFDVTPAEAVKHYYKENGMLQEYKNEIKNINTKQSSITLEIARAYIITF